VKREPLRQEIKHRLAAAFGPRLRGVVLYGSEARGDATDDSDIDLLVLLDGPLSVGADLRAIINALYDLQLQIGRPIHAMPGEYNEYEAAELFLYQEVRREGLWL
jgi:predicted nucleotidyltransferase